MSQPVIISGKRVYTVENHQTVLRCWAAIRNQLERPPILITLDSHTDIDPAFNHRIHVNARRGELDDRQRVWDRVDEYCRAIDYRQPSTVDDATIYLKNDEHIDAAIRAGILDHAYVVTYRSCNMTHKKRRPSLQEFENFMLQTGSEDFDACPFQPYDIPDQRIFVLPGECAVGCERFPHTEECTTAHVAQAIESEYLTTKLASMREMSRAFGIEDVLFEPFVLDIDLDYFRSSQSISPHDPSVFYEMIRRSLAVTIATEPRYVLSERLDGETVTAEWLHPQLVRHIENAMEV